jgi:cobalt-zinc-cadmium efflux system outer membrane protein
MTSRMCGRGGRAAGAGRSGRSAPGTRSLGGAVIVAALVGGCALEPKGTDQERAKLAETGARYEPRFEERTLPELPAEPTWRDVLRRSFLASGELEAAYFDWKAALENVGIASAWPNSDVSLGYSYMFSGERMKSFDRMTFTAGFDSMENLAWPQKAAQAGKVALHQAKAAGERFRFIKFEVQKKVLSAWADYTLRARTIAARREGLALVRVRAENAGIRAGVGMGQEELLEAQLEASRAASELKDLEAEQEGTRAVLNTLMARDARAALVPPARPSEPRPLPDDDALLLAAAADIFPEVGMFAHEVEGRKDALELARMRWLPDINPAVALTGGVSQTVGAVIVLPTTIREIQGRINQAGAELRASEAMLRQKKQDRTAEYVGLLVMLRNARRQQRTLEGEILPIARRLAESRQRSYEAAAGTAAEMIEARRALLEVQVAVAQAEATIEKAIVEIECCLGIDIETVQGPRLDAAGADEGRRSGAAESRTSMQASRRSP